MQGWIAPRQSTYLERGGYVGRSVLVPNKAGTLPCKQRYDMGWVWIHAQHSSPETAHCILHCPHEIFLNSDIWDKFNDMDGTRSVPEPMWDTWQLEPCLTPALPSGYHRHQQHLCLHYWYRWTSFGTPTSDFPQKTIDYSGTHLLSCFVFEQKIHPKAEKLFLIKFLWGLLHSIISFGFSKSGSVWMCGQNKIHLRATSL